VGTDNQARRRRSSVSESPVDDEFHLYPKSGKGGRGSESGEGKQLMEAKRRLSDGAELREKILSKGK